MKLGSRLKSEHSTCTCTSAPTPCDRRRIKSITKSGNKVLVVLDDCTYLEADFSVVDFGVKTDSCCDQVTKLGERLNKLEGSLIPLTDLSGKTTALVVTPGTP